MDFRIAELGRDGHGVSIWCRTRPAAVRIVVALVEGRHDLVGAILRAEDRLDFCVEDRNAEFQMLVAEGRVRVLRAKRQAKRRP